MSFEPTFNEWRKIRQALLAAAMAYEGNLPPTHDKECGPRWAVQFRELAERVPHED